MTTDQDPAALAPCPFCGSKHVRASRYGEVLCMEGDCDARQDSVDAWNRRVPDPAVLALTEERDALRAALSELYATRSVAADIEDGMNVVRCTDAEWDAHVAACRKARAALRGKEGT